MGGSVGSKSGGWFLKLVVAGAVILVCVAGGIYLGDAVVRKSAPTQGPSELMPAIGLGDLFPLLSFVELDGKRGTFDSLLMGRPTELLFLSGGCSRCEDLIDVWNREIQPILKPDVQVIICLRDSTIPPNLIRLIGNRKIIIPDTQSYQIVGLKLTPTVIGLDEYGLVTYIQPGYTEYFGREFYERFAMTAK